MRLRVELLFPQPSELGWGYINQLRGLFYQALSFVDPELAIKLHGKGIEYKGKSYKPFTFSLLFPEENFVVSEHGILIHGRASWWLSSPLPEIMEAIAIGLLRLNEVFIGSSQAFINQIQVVKEPDFNPPLHVYTLSPISISTGQRRGDKFYKVFLSPDEPDFARILSENIKRKYFFLYRKEPEGEVSFTFLKPWHSRLFNIAGTKIRGFEMKLIINGNPELLRLAYQWGLGEHNGSGFGMIATKVDK